MKRILTMLLALAMIFSVAACGKKSDDGANDKPVDVLTKVWETYKDDEKFAAGGGDANNLVMDGPGEYDVSDVEGLDLQLGFPQASVALVDEVASLVHMKNANMFTAGAYYVSDTNEVELLVEDMKDNILSRQWLGGFPDKLIIFGLGDNVVVSVFGVEEIVESFEEKLLSIYKDAQILCQETIR